MMPCCIKLTLVFLPPYDKLSSGPKVLDPGLRRSSCKADFYTSFKFSFYALESLQENFRCSLDSKFYFLVDNGQCTAYVLGLMFIFMVL